MYTGKNARREPVSLCPAVITWTVFTPQGDDRRGVTVEPTEDEFFQQLTRNIWKNAWKVRSTRP